MLTLHLLLLKYYIIENPECSDPTVRLSDTLVWYQSPHLHILGCRLKESTVVDMWGYRSRNKFLSNAEVRRRRERYSEEYKERDGQMFEWSHMWLEVAFHVTESSNARKAHHVIYPFTTFLRLCLKTFGIPALSSIGRLFQNVTTLINIDLLTYHGHFILIFYWYHPIGLTGHIPSCTFLMLFHRITYQRTVPAWAYPNYLIWRFCHILFSTLCWNLPKPLFHSSADTKWIYGSITSFNKRFRF